MRSIAKKGVSGLAAIAASTFALGLVTAGGAQADPAAGSNDIVGVGSDTLQYMLDFGADGDFLGHAGFNAGKLGRVMSFDATPDANARAGYLNGSTTATNLPLNGTIILRGGASPVQRPNGSGAGFTALDNDTAGNINFIRSSSAMSAGNQSGSLVGTLHEVRLAKETIGILAGTTTNAVPLSKQQLKSVYECAAGFTFWDDAAIGGTSHTRIVPVIPQASSGTRKTFLTDIGFTVDGSGNVTENPGSCVQTYEENDPYALFINSTVNGDGSISSTQVSDPYVTGLAANADAIEPMSGGRLNLYKGQAACPACTPARTASPGYFHNPNTALGKAVKAGDDDLLNPAVGMLSQAGNAHDGNPNYALTRGLYVIFRDADINSASHFNGSTKNWVNTLFLAGASGGTPYFASAAGQTLLYYAGVTPDYGDCGTAAGAAGCPPL